MKRAKTIEKCAGEKKAEFGFSIGLPARTFVFAVETEAEQTKWLSALEACRDFEPPREKSNDEEDMGENKIQMPELEISANEKDDETLWVDKYEDFPDGMQKIFRKSKLSDSDVEENMHVVLNVIRFLYKKRHYKTHLDNPWEEDYKKMEGQEKLDKALFDEAEKMYDEITPKTRKKRFKMVKELGKGGFGVVHLAQWVDEKDQVAVKVGREMFIIIY
jgi:hypothetical protein